MRTVIVLLALAGTAHAEDPEEVAPAHGGHATGVWVEAGVDSSVLIANDSSNVVDLPGQHVTIGWQLPHMAFGLTSSLAKLPDQPFRIALGPTAVFEIAGTDSEDSELLAEAGLDVEFGLTSHPMQDGGPTLFTLRAGLLAVHWIDHDFAIGGGIVAHGFTHRDDATMTRETELGVAGTLRVAGVF